MYDYETACKKIREVFDDPCVEKALKYAAENPAVVPDENTPEYERVLHGFFDLYFSVNRSTAEEEGT